MLLWPANSQAGVVSKELAGFFIADIRCAVTELAKCGDTVEKVPATISARK